MGSQTTFNILPAQKCRLTFILQNIRKPDSMLSGLMKSFWLLFYYMKGALAIKQALLNATCGGVY